ncbi:hypothetical protein PYW07_012578 [Mythimna separata]|uniref:Uncharacterized protein n=1 Tax=Mythimna separata TaxID=271217 RepID=A0AAD7Y8I1_MYTSE|nr:hypothetical protein PYW07_012578 [Mythimna separata]
MAVFSIKFYCFLTLSWHAWRSLANPESFYYDDKMGWHEKRKIMLLSMDLFKESLLNMRQIIEVRNEHDMLISFNVGMIMGRIREKYRFMIETYRDVLDQFEKRYYAKPPGIPYIAAMHTVIALETMHYLEQEIDKLVDVLVEEGSSDLNSNRIIIGQTEPRAWWKEDETKPPNKTEVEKLEEDIGPLGAPTGRPKGMRARIDIVREQIEKSKMRESFLMKKLGMGANMTTMKKRFLRHWPVEETWSLDKYNHDYK